MKVAVLCEFSGVVRDAFLREGHEAISCDLLPSERPGPHIQGDCREFDWSGYDLVIAHPPCTHLAISGARWFKGRERQQREALAFVRYLMALDVPRIALENPVSVISTRIRKPNQIIQPWQFGHGETKATCLWLTNLPKLHPTQFALERRPVVHYAAPSPDRGKARSRTYSGIADAMAKQWGAMEAVE